MRNYMLLGFITLAAAFTPIFGKITVSEISPLSLGFLRFSIAAVLFLITLVFRKQNLYFVKKDYPLLIVLAILCIPLNQFFFLTGIKMSYASHSGVLYSLNPVFAYSVSVIKKNEKFFISKFLAILLTVTGIFFVFYEALTTSETNNVLQGDILLVFAVLSFSLYISLGKGLIKKYGALKVTTFVFLLGSLFNLPVFLYDVKNLTFSNLSLKGLIGLLYLSIVISYGAYFLWYYALKTIQVSRITTLTNLSPVITVFFSVLFLQEHISLYFIIGALITITGVIIMHRASIELN